MFQKIPIANRGETPRTSEVNKELLREVIKSVVVTLKV